MSETSATANPFIVVAERERPSKRVTPLAAASAATRYLAAAAYIDREFRDKAIETDEAEFRASAPELGIDSTTVVDHCRIARRRKALRDAALCVVVIVIATTGIFAELLQYPDYFGEILDEHSAALFGCWALAAAIVFAEIYLTQHITLTCRFARNFASQAPDSPASASSKPRNVIVSGAFSPFVGSGFDIGGWSFTVNLEQGKLGIENCVLEPFDIGELYDALRSGFERLAIDGLSISDRLFVDGRSIRDDRRFLPDPLSPPVSNVADELVNFFRMHSEKTVRHYLCLEIADWSGELVLSTFIRLQKSASKLFVEVSNFLLPPLKRQYYELDKRAPTRLIRKSLGWLVRAAILAPMLAPIALVTTWANIWRPVGQFTGYWRRRREVRHNPLHNYGALRSIRELGTENSWRLYFQKLDKEMHTKVVQQQMLDVLIAFLDEHGVDTSEIKDRGNHILNNGVIVSGGSIQAEGLAVGTGAQANIRKIGRALARGAK